MQAGRLVWDAGISLTTAMILWSILAEHPCCSSPSLFPFASTVLSDDSLPAMMLLSVQRSAKTETESAAPCCTVACVKPQYELRAVLRALPCMILAVSLLRSKHAVLYNQRTSVCRSCFQHLILQPLIIGKRVLFATSFVVC
jgi:hypothetical protein